MPRDPRAVHVLPIAHPKGCRSYVVVDPASREACVVDPLLDRVGEALRLLSEHGASLRWIVDTHSHGDHLSGAAALRERTGAEIVVHAAAPCTVATVRAGDGERLALGEQVLVVHHAPGNTADGIVLEAPGTLFTGDLLLIGTVGVRDAGGGDADTCFATFRRVFDRHPDGTVVHPGHDDMGRTMSTLRQERSSNTWLREGDLEAFRERFAANQRTSGPEVEARLAANREGVTRAPRDLEAAAGLPDPARATEAALRRVARSRPEEQAAPATLPDRVQGTYLLVGAAIVVSTLLGWLVHPLLHIGAAAAGVVLLALGLVGGAPRRRRRGAPEGLFYEGPTRKTTG